MGLTRKADPTFPAGFAGCPVEGRHPARRRPSGIKTDRKNRRSSRRRVMAQPSVCCPRRQHSARPSRRCQGLRCYGQAMLRELRLPDGGWPCRAAWRPRSDTLPPTSRKTDQWTCGALERSCSCRDLIVKAVEARRALATCRNISLVANDSIADQARVASGLVSTGIEVAC